MGWMSDETGLDKCAANYVPLTPLSHLSRANIVYLIDRGIYLCFERGFRRCFHFVPRSGAAPGAHREILAGVENRAVGVVRRVPYLSIFSSQR